MTAGPAGEQQRDDWLAWEGELRAAIATLRASGEHERVVRFLDDRASMAMHNAYCSTPMPFSASGLPAIR